MVIVNQNDQPSASTPRRTMPGKPWNEAQATKLTASERLGLLSSLQTTLDLDGLMALFFDGIQPLVPVNSLRFQQEGQQIGIVLGRECSHSANYSLLTDNAYLGELSFTRNKRFSEGELARLEALIGVLLCPLRNALQYLSALQTALRDPLTGVGNRRALEQLMDREIALAHRQQEPLSLLMVDVDHFKRINDRFGHSAGDCVIRDVARMLTAACRQTDMIFRFGGEEFAVVLNRADSQSASVIAERVRTMVAEATTAVGEQVIDCTVSVGIATLMTGESLKGLLDRADHALYEAKNAGRNCVRVAEQCLGQVLAV